MLGGPGPLLVPLSPPLARRPDPPHAILPRPPRGALPTGTAAARPRLPARLLARMGPLGPQAAVQQGPARFSPTPPPASLSSAGPGPMGEPLLKPARARFNYPTLAMKFC